MELYRDIGVISQTEFESIFNACDKDATTEDCNNKVNMVKRGLSRLKTGLMELTFMMHTGLAGKRKQKICPSRKNSDLLFVEKINLKTN